MKKNLGYKPITLKIDKEISRERVTKVVDIEKVWNEENVFTTENTGFSWFLKWGIKNMPVNAKSKTKWETNMHNSNGKISKPLIVLFRLDISCTAVNLEKYN